MSNVSNVNKNRFQLFLRQAKGSKLFELHVNREDRRSEVVLRYNGTAPKQRNRLTGEWRIEKGEKDEAALQAEVKEFLALARAHFLVHRGEGLGDEVYADPTQEAEVKPITKS
ncbi:MAG: hypothetical protein AB7N76_36420 [Planctomycetota bacterium]